MPMTTNTCDSCKTKLQPHDNIMLKLEDGDQHLCSHCYNEVMAEYLGEFDYENIYFEPDVMTDTDGLEHTFSFSSRLIGAEQVVMEATEVKEDGSTGYTFQIIDDTKTDPLVRYKILYEKMKRGLGIKHIQPDDLTRYSITDPGIVRGHITSDLDDENDMPVVVIDGKEVSWSEFGAMVGTYMGFNFKLELFDRSEEK